MSGATVQVFDQETGLFQNWNRDYNPRLGRYIESDPIGLYGGQVSTYAYVGGNPLSDVDPLGLGSTSITLYVPALGPIGPGGSLIFGTNPDGSGFMSFKLGIGLGGGYKYDPNGKSPGYGGSAGCRWGGGWNVYAGADFNAGPIYSQLGVSRGVNVTSNGPQFYSGGSATSGARGKVSGISSSASMGTQVSVFGGGTCVCGK